MFSHLLQKIRTIFSHPSYWRAIIACHYGEPLHYHHDGCPACMDIHLSNYTTSLYIL